MKLLHLSDPHIDGKGESFRAAVQRLSGLMQAGSLRPDAAVITGDLSARGDRDSYDCFQHLCSGLGLPVLVCAGNHDDPDHVSSLRGSLISGLQYQAGPMPLDYVVELGDCTLAMLDTRSSSRAEEGRLDRATVDWLDEIVLPRGRELVIALHQPPFSLVDGIAPLGNGDTLLALFGRHQNLRLALCGHIHRCTSHFSHGTPVVTINSTSHQIAFDPGTGDRPYAITSDPPMAGLVDVGAFVSVQFVPLRTPSTDALF